MQQITKYEGEKILWIDWGRHLRTQTLVQRLGISLEEIAIKGGRIRRYIRSSMRTLAAIRKTRPRVVIATNPSIVLGYLLLVLRAIYGFRLVSDAHWLGVKAGHGNPRVQKLLDFHNSKVDMVIVTNDNHAKFIESLGGHAAVCEDPLPVLPAPSLPAEALPEKSVFLVCSFDIDEPYEAVFQAFKALKDDGYVLYVSGNYRRARVDPARFPWIRFLGFLPESEYYAYLWSCSVILDLTTLEDCLVCGGYEALAAGKALVLSNTAAIQAYFGAGALTTPNTEAAIGKSVVAAYEKKAELERKAGQWADDSVVKMDQRILHLKAMLSTLASEKNFQRAR